MIGKPLVLYSGKLTKKRNSDAGFDIHSSVDAIIHPSSSVAVKTGLKIGVPIDNVGLVKPRSGTSFKNDIETGAGVIDSDYRGDVMVKLYNHNPDNEFRINKGDRIAQLLIIPVDTRQYIVEEVVEETERGDSGFGSSGTGEEIL